MLTNTPACDAVRHWVETVVIELNLCPFARRELLGDRIRFAESVATNETELLEALVAELLRLQDDASIATTLLIHPQVLTLFDDYNQFLTITDELLAQMHLAGVFQIASFHPDYQFADTEAGDAENFTNRSPYPMLHILREASVAKAIAGTRDVDLIPTRNIETMNRLGAETMKQRLQACLVAGDRDN